jgi:ubiquinone biosynthesis protein
MFAELKSAAEFAHLVPRYREILGVLYKHGFGDLLKLVLLQKVIGREETALQASVVEQQLMTVRVRLVLEELGPTFIKFGQILSSRRDLIPDDLYCELCKLQDNVPPFDGKEAKAIVEKELGKPIKSLFSSFNEKPLAGASIAQVHKAKLRDGTVVAVKVQRPDIKKVMELDLAILKDLASFADKHIPEISGMNPVGVVREFSETLIKELDFNQEANNATRFRDQFEGNPKIKVPKIYPEFSTSHVLTMEFISGLNVNDLEALDEAGIDKKKLARNMTDLIYQQVLEHGFFHGDPHPGNMYIQPDGVVALLDYGMMGNLTPSFRTALAQLLSGLAKDDSQQVMSAILEISEERYTDEPQKMLAAVEAFSDLHLSQSLSDINLSHVLNKMLELLRDNKLRMKATFYLGVKALTQIEAVGRALDPELNFVAAGEPYVRKMIEGRYQYPHVSNVLYRLMAGSLDFLEEFPTDFRNLYQRIKAGKFNIPIEHKIDPQGFDPMRQTLHSIANLLAAAILTASVLICSSILMLASVPPHIWGISLFGFLGLIWGATMGFRLAIHIWKHGGL